MFTATRSHRLAAAAALSLGLAAPAAIAQAIDGGPTPEGKTAALRALDRSAPVAESSAGSSATNTQAADAGTPAEGQTAADADMTSAVANSIAAAHSVARWARRVGARICLGPKIEPNDRVSRPNISDQAQGWRVSVPTFAASRVSAPPLQVARNRTADTTETSGESGIETASQPTGDTQGGN